MNESNTKIVKKVLPYLWPKDNSSGRMRVIISLISMVFAKIISISIPFLYKHAVDSLAGEANIFILGAIGLTIAYGVAKVLSVIFEEIRNLVFASVGQAAIRSLAHKTITHIHKLSMRYHISRKTGALSRVIERGVKGIDFLLRHFLFNVVPLIIELSITSFILVYVFGFWYFVIVIGTIIFYIFLTSYITEWRVRIRREMNERDKDANQKAIDSLLNFETVKYFSSEDIEAKRYDDSMAEYEKASIMTIKSLSVLNILQSITINAALVAVMVMVALEVMAGDLSIGDFVMINAYMLQLMLPLHFLGFVYREIRQALIDMQEMFELLDQPAEVTDKRGAKDLEISKGKIEFKNVNFGYEKERQIIKNFSMTIKPGEKVAIVGSTGSGKSTIGRLLFRFYDVWDGAIYIDNQEVKDLAQRSLQKMIGVIPQDTVLFNDSIYYNIGYGNPNATSDDIIEAAKAAKIHDFIASLPNGYQTLVGERGLKLSGGEKQRIGIARTILKDPPILLLDEATSALDTKTEKDIQDSLNKLTKDHTVLVIAHRLSTIVDAAKIIVLEKGEILEQGSHKDLLKKKGKYYEMWHQQLKEE